VSSASGPAAVVVRTWCRPCDDYYYYYYYNYYNCGRGSMHKCASKLPTTRQNGCRRVRARIHDMTFARRPPVWASIPRRQLHVVLRGSHPAMSTAQQSVRQTLISAHEDRILNTAVMHSRSTWLTAPMSLRPAIISFRYCGLLFLSRPRTRYPTR
jgi:hypothetical protein